MATCVPRLQKYQNHTKPTFHQALQLDDHKRSTPPNSFASWWNTFDRGGWYIESNNLFETKMMSLFTHKVSRIFHFDYVSTWGAWSINYVFWSSNNTPIHEITFRVYWNSTNYQHFQLGHCLILSVIPKQSIHAFTGNIHIFIASWFFFMI